MSLLAHHFSYRDQYFLFGLCAAQISRKEFLEDKKRISELEKKILLHRTQKPDAHSATVQRRSRAGDARAESVLSYISSKSGDGAGSSNHTAARGGTQHAQRKQSELKGAGARAAL